MNSSSFLFTQLAVRMSSNSASTRCFACPSRHNLLCLSSVHIVHVKALQFRDAPSPPNVCNNHLSTRPNSGTRSYINISHTGPKCLFPPPRIEPSSRQFSSRALALPQSLDKRMCLSFFFMAQEVTSFVRLCVF